MSAQVHKHSNSQCKPCTALLFSALNARKEYLDFSCSSVVSSLPAATFLAAIAAGGIQGAIQVSGFNLISSSNPPQAQLCNQAAPPLQPSARCWLLVRQGDLRLTLLPEGVSGEAQLRAAHAAARM